MNNTAIVEASDIPILSSTDRLQRTLLRWVDICGLSGQFVTDADIVEALAGHELLDDQSYLVELEGDNPARWQVVWAGSNVIFDTDSDFRESFYAAIPDDRFIGLIAREYSDAVRYRRASARRFAHRNKSCADMMDQLIFPIRDASRSEFVLIIGEAVTGRTVYVGAQKENQAGKPQ
jgi:hypothetical protein